MSQEEKEALDKQFEREQELRFWETIFEASINSLLFKPDSRETYAEISTKSGILADVSVQERRKFLRKQKEEKDAEKVRHGG